MNALHSGWQPPSSERSALPVTERLSDIQRAAGETPRIVPRAISAEGAASIEVARLRVVRGLRQRILFSICAGSNLIGRCDDDRPVDIDLSDQEPADRVWTSRHHARIVADDGSLTIEDLGSTNGTYVNRRRVEPRRPHPLRINDIVQIGTVQFRVESSAPRTH